MELRIIELQSKEATSSYVGAEKLLLPPMTAGF